MRNIKILVIALIMVPLFSVCKTSNTVKEEPFTVKLESPKIRAGDMEAHFENIINIGGLRQVGINVDYYSLEDAVCLQYRIDFMTFYQFWSRDGREAFIKALEQYKEDYEQKNLKPKGSKKTKHQYGKTEGYLIWQAAKYTVRAFAPVNIELGYFIKNVSKNRASFFTLFQREAVFIDEVSKNEKRQTNNITIYLTRAQADELAGFFDQDFLRTLVSEKPGQKPFNPSIDAY
jgi:hypothetical protein